MSLLKRLGGTPQPNEVAPAFLFLACDALRVLPDRVTFDFKIIKDMIPVVGLNVLGLRYTHRYASHSPIHY